MSINQQDISQEASKLLKDKSWKGHLTLGIVLIIVGGIIASPVFAIISALLEAVLVIGGIALVCWAGYQYYQLQEKK